MVNKTAYEELIERINEEVKQDLNSRTNLDRKRLIIKAVASVYWFLRKELGISWRPMTLEEFKIVRAQFKDTALPATSSLPVVTPSRLWQKKKKPDYVKPEWQHYIEFGFFNFYNTPFGDWHGYHCWYDFSHFQKFDIDWVLSGNYKNEARYYKAIVVIPPNIKELTESLFNEGYGLEYFK